MEAYSNIGLSDVLLYSVQEGGKLQMLSFQRYQGHICVALP